MISNIKQKWYELSLRSDSLDFILPKRTNKEFWDEGKSQAYEIANLFNRENDKILEFGCGVGRILKFLEAKEKHGCDASEIYLNKIDDPKVTKHANDGLSLIHRYDYFDFIYSIMVFQHIPKKVHGDILQNILKCLKPNGSIYFQFPQKPNEYYIETEFVNTYTKEELIQMFSKAGFINVNIEEGNLVGYGSNGEYKPKGNLEYFVKAQKKSK